MQKRCSELGIPVARMAEKNNISNITLERIKKNGQIKPATKEKLARGMLCTICEIDTAIAQDEQVTPFGETVRPEQPSVMETVDRLEEMVKDAAAEEPVKPQHVDRAERQEPPMKVPAKKTVWYEEQTKKEKPKEQWPEEDDPEECVSVLENCMQEGERRFRQKLKDLFIKTSMKFSLEPEVESTVFDLDAAYGRAVLEVLAEEEES